MTEANVLHQMAGSHYPEHRQDERDRPPAEQTQQNCCVRTSSTAMETTDCLKCKDLSGALAFSRNEYAEARFSAYYRVSTELAAKKNVDMERARYDMEEHTSVCASYAERKLLG